MFDYRRAVGVNFSLKRRVFDRPNVSIRSRAFRLARLATEMFAPAALVALLLVLLGWHSSGYQPEGLALGVVAGVFESVIPFAYIVRQVRAGRLTDHHIGVREQRARPLLFALGSVVVGFGALIGLGAPRVLLAGVVAGGCGLVVAILVSRWWKMSIHAAVAAGACAIGVELFGPIALLGLPLIGLVSWSRVALRAHTVAQVLVGAVVGALIAGTAFGVLR
jgi:membrane-associated phospholipid phosphatase